MYDKYFADIDGWKWGQIIEQCRSNLVTVEGNRVGMYLVGTVFNLLPSGKYYQPFACSNVTPCPKCHGNRTVKNPLRQRRRAERTQRRLRQLVKQYLGLYGIHDKWPRSQQERVKRLRAIEKKYHANLTCSHCEGVGSREAHLDEVWWKAFEAVADKHGCFVTSGEGDPCDIFVGMAAEEEEEEEEESNAYSSA